MEHFRDSCGGVISWLDSSTSYTAFSEGWALYAENPLIARDTNVYETEPFQKYGMLKWQVRDQVWYLADNNSNNNVYLQSFYPRQLNNHLIRKRI